MILKAPNRYKTSRYALQFRGSFITITITKIKNLQKFNMFNIKALLAASLNNSIFYQLPYLTFFKLKVSLPAVHSLVKLFKKNEKFIERLKIDSNGIEL